MSLGLGFIPQTSNMQTGVVTCVSVTFFPYVLAESLFPQYALVHTAHFKSCFNEQKQKLNKILTFTYSIDTGNFSLYSNYLCELRIALLYFVTYLYTHLTLFIEYEQHHH